jgi:SAM-dependent methyltransferase
MTRKSEPAPGTAGNRFAAQQWEYFQHVDAARFHWQTTAPFFSATEADLVRCAAGPGRLLEVGTGEGGNLFHLGPRPDVTVGLDYVANKVAFASCAIPWARFVCADALHLPFRPGAFDRVFCRDVLHHLEPDATQGAVGELFRVCRPGGQVILIEPNGRNPIIGAFALVTPAERGMIRSTPEGLAFLAHRLTGRVTVKMAQPLPVARVLLHYRFGMPGLGRLRWVTRALALSDRILRSVLPRCLWAYVIVSSQAPSAPAEAGR